MTYGFLGILRAALRAPSRARFRVEGFDRTVWRLGSLGFRVYRRYCRVSDTFLKEATGSAPHAAAPPKRGGRAKTCVGFV